jgi:hypothetical protein
MQLQMPRGQVVSPRRRGYAGNCIPRQAFFSYFFNRFLGQNLSSPKAATLVPLRLARVPSSETNHKENNPAQIEAEGQTYHRAGWERDDVFAERIDFRPSRARRFWSGLTADDKSAFHQT